MHYNFSSKISATIFPVPFVDLYYMCRATEFHFGSFLWLNQLWTSILMLKNVIPPYLPIGGEPVVWKLL